MSSLPGRFHVGASDVGVLNVGVLEVGGASGPRPPGCVKKEWAGPRGSDRLNTPGSRHGALPTLSSRPSNSGVAAPRRLIVTNDLFSNDGLEIVAIFFFAAFFFSGLWKKVCAGSDRGFDCLCAARAPWRYEFKAPAYETLGGRLSNATVHRQQTHTLDAVLRGLDYKGCARSGQACAAQKGVAQC